MSHLFDCLLHLLIILPITSIDLLRINAHNNSETPSGPILLSPISDYGFTEVNQSIVFIYSTRYAFGPA